MLTPQEVAEHAFSKATFGGYSMTMVDDFLDILTGDYTSLYEENAVLKRKMKVLADKVEEYRSTDDAMRRALLTVQQQADEMVRDAQAKKTALLDNAEAEAEARRQELETSLAAEEQRLANAKANAAEYLSALKSLVSQEQTRIGELEAACGVTAAQAGVSPAAPAGDSPKQDSVQDAAEEIKDSMERLLEEEDLKAAQAASVQQPQPAAPVQAAPVEAAPVQAAPAQAAPVEAAPVQAAPVQAAPAEAAPVQAAPAEAAAVPTAPGAPSAAEVDEPTRRIDFDNLQFGKDYEIK